MFPYLQFAGLDGMATYFFSIVVTIILHIFLSAFGAVLPFILPCICIVNHSDICCTFQKIGPVLALPF